MDGIGVGGAEILTLGVLSRLDRSAFRPHALCIRFPGDLSPRFEAADVPVGVIGSRGRNPLTAVRLAHRLRAGHADIVLTTAHRASLLLARLAGPLASVRANVLAIHDMDGKGLDRPSLPRWAVETMFLTDVLVGLSPAQLRYLEREEGLNRYSWRRTRQLVIPNGIDVGPPPTMDARVRARATLGLSPADQVIGCVAGLRPEKGHDVLLRAVALLAPTRPRLKLALIGGGDREQPLRRLVADLGLADRVLFTGVRADARDLLAAFDVKCLSSRREAFPLSVLEAMAAARPVVVPDCGALPDIVEEGVQGFRTAPGDHLALAPALGRLIDDPALGERMGAAGRVRVQREFRIETTVSRFEALLAEIGSPRRSMPPGARGRRKPRAATS
jgi:glycosyltransferase involved in cell wall biosynthesis